MTACLAIASGAVAQSANKAAKTPGPSAQMMAPMKQGMTRLHSMKLSGDVDRDFALMMAEHHRMGVQMMEVYLKHADNQHLAAMAQTMSDRQRKETRDLEAWLEQHPAKSK
jgi:uncharacterized protein (DUF305 family)